MFNIPYPEITNVEVIPTQPKPADVRSIEYIQTTNNITLDNVTYIVKISLKNPLPVTSQGFTLFLDNYRVSKYFQFPGGIYFKVYDPNFLTERAGNKLLFSIPGVGVRDTGYQLPDNSTSLVETIGTRSTSILPTQEEVLSR